MQGRQVELTISKRKIYFVYALILHSNTHNCERRSHIVLHDDGPLVRARFPQYQLRV